MLSEKKREARGFWAWQGRTLRECSICVSKKAGSMGGGEKIKRTLGLQASLRRKRGMREKQNQTQERVGIIKKKVEGCPKNWFFQ